MSEEDHRQDANGVRSARQAAAALRSAAILSGIGFLLAGSVTIGTLGGMWLDRWLGTEPWLTALGALLGTAAGFIQMFRLVKLTEKNRQ